MIEDGDKKLIAKFSSSSDTYNVVKAEFIAMRLAAKAGLDVAPVRLAHVAGQNVLLVERFDRLRTNDGWQRKAMVSALTIFGLDEMMARYASYADLTEIIRHRFSQPKDTLRELFGLLVFNILCGNTDDHARNHAAFWDGKMLHLTPAYDICPQSRAGNEASQAMLITGNNRRSALVTCMEAAPNFLIVWSPSVKRSAPTRGHPGWQAAPPASRGRAERWLPKTAMPSPTWASPRLLADPGLAPKPFWRIGSSSSSGQFRQLGIRISC